MRPGFDSGKKAFIMACAAMAFFVVAIYDQELSRILKLDFVRVQSAVKAGYWMGHAAFCLPILFIVYLAGRKTGIDRLRQAGGKAFWAFVLSGIFAQIIKHIIGRPRPRLWKEGVEHFGPTLASGLDSFPSGHTTNSMAVALVLSYYYPKGAPVFMGAASFVAATRLLGGSHFPLDIMGGILVGLISGLIVLRLPVNKTGGDPEKGARP